MVEKRLEDLREEWQIKWNSLIRKIGPLFASLETLQDQHDALEQYIRRPCLIIKGLKETPKEDLLSAVPSLFANKLGINISSKDLVAVHRLPNHRKDNKTSNSSERQPSSPAAVIVKFLYMRDRDNVFFNKKKLKGTDFIISENLTQKRSALLKSVCDLSFTSWTYNGDIFVLDKNNKRRKVKNIQDLERYGQNFQKRNQN